MIKVAIVEDFELIREDLKELIDSQEDMQVVWAAETGVQAVELAEKEATLKWKPSTQGFLRQKKSGIRIRNRRLFL